MRKEKIRLLVSTLVAFVIITIIAIVAIILGMRAINRYRGDLETLQSELDANTRTVFVAIADIKPGDVISESNVVQQRIRSGLPPATYINQTNLGDTACISIPIGMPVMANMVTKLDITNDTRMYEISVAHLMTTQREHDVVDVRVMFPNGEDFLLLSKKTVYDLQLGTSVFSTYLNEDEILRIASATIDAYTTSGAKIYTTKYLETNLQKNATPTYLVKPAVIDLINSDPNVIERAESTLNLNARADLDARLGNLSEDQLQAVTDGLGIEDTAKGNIIRENARLTDGAIDYQQEESVPQEPALSSDMSEVLEEGQ